MYSYNQVRRQLSSAAIHGDLSSGQPHTDAPAETSYGFPSHPAVQMTGLGFGDNQRESPADRFNTASENISNQGNNEHFLEVMCEQMALNRIPAVEPAIFDGKNSLAFPLWQKSFDSMVSNRAMTMTDRVNLLNRYLGGEARSAIEGYLTMPPEEAYNGAYRLLVERYGDSFELANDYCKKLKSWPHISGTDMTGLRHYVDYLKQCLSAKSTLRGLSILDAESENIDMAKRLPMWLSRRWSRKVSNYREEYNDSPSFEIFVSFLAKEDKMAHDPVARALQRSETTKKASRGLSFASEGSRPTGIGSNFGACAFCKEIHSILTCTKFRIKSWAFRIQYVKDNRLCFACLNKGHQARDCRSRKVCEFCQGRHPTIMHTDQVDSPGTAIESSATTCASNDNLSYTSRKSSMVVPVYVSHVDHPTKQVVVYAMLDTQSDTSFITERTARDLGLTGKEVRLSLSTMTSNDKIIRCRRFNGLQVRGFNSQLNIDLPGVFSRPSIPINRDHIPCAEMLDGWPHLEILRDKLMPKIGCEVGLLIGYDCPRALVTKKVISTSDNSDGPYGLKTDLGWSVMGIVTQSTVDSQDSIGYSHHIVSSQVNGSQIPERIKEVVSPSANAAKDVYPLLR